MGSETWWRISGRRWTFAVIEKDGVVTYAAPISVWAIGQSVPRVIEWWKRKGADDVRRISP